MGRHIVKIATGSFVFMLGLWALSGVLWANALSVSSPDEKITVRLSLEGARLSYQVTREGAPVIGRSRLGLRLKNAPHLEGEFIVASSVTKTVDETWTQPWGEVKDVRNHYRELRAVLQEEAGLKRQMIVTFRVYNDGLGFRYELPAQENLGAVEIMAELTEFNVIDPATAWWTPAREWNRYEYLYDKTPLGDVSHAHTPLTLRTDKELHISIHEAALVDYAAMTLKRGRGQVMVADLTPRSDGIKVKATAPFHSPWRTLQISEDAGGLITSNLILNLNEPNKLGDVSWVEIGKYVGIWWEMHLGVATWESGPIHGATTARTKRYIDFAADHGFTGVLVEGWNIGWDDDWYNNGDIFRFTEAYKDFDITALSDYARSKGVRLIGHHETSGGISNYEAQLGAALDYYQKLGVAAIKTGYVADGGETVYRETDGRVRYEWHDSQAMVNHYQKVVEEAAKRQIAINTHEPIKDTGLRRTYPNWVAREGARGQEYNAWGEPGNNPEHTAILPFTRMLSGPMDFTPGIFDLLFEKEKPDNRIPTTLAKQLALYVVLYSPIQMAADLPENYEARMAPFQFIKDVPTDWELTKVLNGEIGEYVTIVRKDRASADWYLGSLTNEVARSLDISLDFLEDGVTYVAQIYRDGPNADWQTDPYDMVIEEKRVTRGDKMTLKLATSGGQGIRFTPVEK
ncbi:glycoside hydrolase family 97 protein [Paremcibacter congregatus]|uniref:Alpha-glucosidase n=1 Tax=Paremcibacter congregatus TaxID=2043170 RepID=A0A2G4YS14_9PROT|nr:glycoside hydrolase family 97 protein [Paremcibacter congregatus]PHZ85122.1 alpha-glucosidase [Paremcibacter congregatus]QDE27942.1 glycoside hydrolase family 97 protein [Paremcibacter congregatus]